MGRNWHINEEEDEFIEPTTFDIQDEFNKSSKSQASIDFILGQIHNKLATRDYRETIVRRITQSTIKYLWNSDIDKLSYVIAEYVDNGYEPLGQISAGNGYNITMIRRNTIKEL